MGSLFQSLFTAVLLYRYTAIFAIEAIGTLGVPVPSGAVLLSSFIFSSQGYLNPYLVGLVGWSAAVLGDLAGFVLARRYGKTVLIAIGLRRLIDAPSFIKIEHRIEHAPKITVIFSRIITTIAPIVNVVAGVSRMSIQTFLIADIIGQLLNTLLNAFYGYVIGDSWTTIIGVTGNVGIFISLLLILLLLRGRWLFSRVTRHFKK